MLNNSHASSTLQIRRAGRGKSGHCVTGCQGAKTETAEMRLAAKDVCQRDVAVINRLVWATLQLAKLPGRPDSSTAGSNPGAAATHQAAVMKRKSGQNQPSKRRKSSDAAAPDAVVIREGPGFTQLSLPPGQVCYSNDIQPAAAAAASGTLHSCKSNIPSA